MKINLVGYALIALIAVVCYRIWLESDAFQLKCIVSDIDGKQYCVRERNKLTLAADRLARVNQHMQALVDIAPRRTRLGVMLRGW